MAQTAGSMSHSIQSQLQLSASVTPSQSLVNLAQNTSQDKHKPFPPSPWLSVSQLALTPSRRCNFEV